jgi:hypothetical protein
VHRLYNPCQPATALQIVRSPGAAWREAIVRGTERGRRLRTGVHGGPSTRRTVTSYTFRVAAKKYD